MRKWSGCKLPLKLSRAIDKAVDQVYKDENFTFSNDIKLKDQIESNERKKSKDSMISIESNAQITSKESPDCEVANPIPSLEKKILCSMQNM